MSNHISTVRQHLLDTLTDLRNRENPMDIERARAVAEVANVIVNTAKVEVDFLKVTNQDKSSFLEPAPYEGVPQLGNDTGSGYTQGQVTHFPGVTRHMLKG